MSTATTPPTTKRMTAEEFCDWVQLPENVTSGSSFSEGR